MRTEGATWPLGVEPGPAFVYGRTHAPHGARRWPVGSILVKTVENGEPPDWTIHAMVKRGGRFNREGAIGWEYFELAFEDDGETLRVLGRWPL